MCVFSEGLANTNFVVFDLTPSEIKLITASRTNYTSDVVRDRPFNLQGGVMFFFVSFRNFFSDNTRVRILFFPHNLTLGYMTKTLNQIIFFSSTKIRIFFSATLGIRIFFLEKNQYPPLEVKWSVPQINVDIKLKKNPNIVI